ncbi:response regulator [Simplicispira psychrophila]|uniref:response regulator n=1 Tax=Simplicispira psychrophila TaxID=80882 RepID=UPI000691E8D3|nr:response regulator [Simplicispira psychrophila]
MSWNRTITNDLTDATALVADANNATRSVMLSQLRALGVRSIRQASRASDARRHLEAQTFDIVLCEQNFPQESVTGQELLDDLRRGGMLPLATIFIMVTPEASYSKVSEAAESMLDSYLLKPFTAARLQDRISQARQRKVALQDIHQAIEDQEFTQAARLCLMRLNERGAYWTYAARVGAELLLRLGRFDMVQKLYESVLATEKAPWARLGLARVQLEMGQPHKAKPLLEALLLDENIYADAYDNLARTLMELGQFDEALHAYQMSTELTPSSIARLQRHGMLAFYLGDKEKAIGLLEGAVRLGLGSKMFDGQTLTLLGIARFDIDEPKQLRQFLLDQQRMSERNPESVRLRRMVQTLQVLDACISMGKDKAKSQDKNKGDDKTEAELQAETQAPTLEALAVLTKAILEPDFDFEAACNLLSVLALLPTRNVTVPDAEHIVHKLGMRFATSMAMSELLMGAARKDPRFCELLGESNTHVLQLLEQALSPSRNGDPGKAVETLFTQGLASLNAKVIETAWRVLQRYQGDISNAAELTAKIEPWRVTLGTAYNKPVLGDRNMRQSGGVSLRGMDTPPLQPTMAVANAST